MIELEPRETIIDKHCVGCHYYTGITESIYYCSYFIKEDKRRPCPPGKDCTEKKPRREKDA